MKEFSLEGVDWHIDDDGLEAVAAMVPSERRERRTYAVYTTAPGRKVFVKSFSEKGVGGYLRNRFVPRGKLEYDLGLKLTDLGILTPRPLGYAVSRDASFVIQEYVEGRSLLEISRDEGLSQRIMELLALLLKGLRQYCIRHNDLHLDNILLSKDRLYLIDLHKMKIKRSFSGEDEVSNLSHSLVAIYDDMDDSGKEHFFRDYGNSRIRPQVEAEFEMLRQRWFERKKRRAFQETSKISRSGEVASVTGSGEKPAGQLVEVVKEDKKVRVERYTDHIRKIYRSRRRLERAWKANVVLTYMDLAVTPKVFYVKRTGLLSGGFVAMEDLSGQGEELDRYLDRQYDAMPGRQRKKFGRDLAAFFADLLKNRVIHKDLKACNVFVLQGNGFRLLDVEDILFRNVAPGDMKRLFLQLNTTIPKRIGPYDRVRFFTALGKASKMGKTERKSLLREVARESRVRPIVYEGVSGLVEDKW
jgi:tRNA A-37 threonylcarbamoyl transferase component Bud32